MAGADRRDSGVYAVVFTFLLTFAIVTVVSATYAATRTLEERNETRLRQMAVLRALGVPVPAGAGYGEVARAYDAIRADDGYRFHGAAGEVVGRTFRGPGVWGEIHGVLGVQTNDLRITGVEILRHSETPGLGGRIASQWFLEQFRGERIHAGGITVAIRGPGNRDPEDGTVDGIAGATGTTRAFDRILQRELSGLIGSVTGEEG